jgi:glycosyltransferase involved in cell wall biosynthesis
MKTLFGYEGMNRGNMLIDGQEYPLVSVIIPVYKVESFLNTCVSSVVGQAYSNLDIILVDDGSPDSCPQLCDEWARRDSRIRVFHKTNGGLSDARNYGIARARGEFVYCLDSDDRVDSTLLAKTMSKLLGSGADMIFFEYCLESEDGNSTIQSKDTPSFPLEGKRTAEQALELLWTWKIPNYAWSFVAKKSLFDTVEFPKGELMEDVATTYKLIGNATEGVYFLPEEMYFYRVRKGSILGKATPLLCTDNLPHIMAVDAYAKERYPQLLRIELNWSMRFLIGDLFHARIMHKQFPAGSYRVYKRQVCKLLGSHYRELGRSNTSRSNRLKMLEIRCGLLPLRSYVTYLRHKNTR